MKHFVPSLLVLIMLLYSGTAKAQETSLYLSLKGGWMMADPSKYGDAFNAGLLFGGLFFQDPSSGSLAIEGEISRTLSDGRISSRPDRGDWEIDTIALYGVYRTPGKYYFKGKLGFLHEDVTFRHLNQRTINDDDTVFSLGLGVGWNIDDRTSLELDYTLIEDDVDFLGAAYTIYF